MKPLWSLCALRCSAAHTQPQLRFLSCEHLASLSILSNSLEQIGNAIFKSRWRRAFSTHVICRVEGVILTQDTLEPKSEPGRAAKHPNSHIIDILRWTLARREVRRETSHLPQPSAAPDTFRAAICSHSQPSTAIRSHPQPIRWMIRQQRKGREARITNEADAMPMDRGGRVLLMMFASRRQIAPRRPNEGVVSACANGGRAVRAWTTRTNQQAPHCLSEAKYITKNIYTGCRLGHLCRPGHQRVKSKRTQSCCSL